MLQAGAEQSRADLATLERIHECAFRPVWSSRACSCSSCRGAAPAGTVWPRTGPEPRCRPLPPPSIRCRRSGPFPVSQAFSHLGQPDPTHLDAGAHDAGAVSATHLYGKCSKLCPLLGLPSSFNPRSSLHSLYLLMANLSLVSTQHQRRVGSTPVLGPVLMRDCRSGRWIAPVRRRCREMKRYHAPGGHVQSGFSRYRDDRRRVRAGDGSGYYGAPSALLA